jgi:hypothetical protein
MISYNLLIVYKGAVLELSADITLYFNKEFEIYTSDDDRDPEIGCTPGRRKFHL